MGRPTTGPKGRKIIARGEAPGREAKGNQPRRGDTKGRIIGLKRLLFSQKVVLLRLRKQIILPPLRGLSYGITFTGGLHPPLYPVGLSGRTLKFLYIELGLRRLFNTHEGVETHCNASLHCRLEIPIHTRRGRIAIRPCNGIEIKLMQAGSLRYSWSPGIKHVRHTDDASI